MTGALCAQAEVPSTSGVTVPRTGLLRRGRPAAQQLIRAWWDLELHGVERVPKTGPVVMAANHVGWLDGPLLAISSPRPVHALTKTEMFAGPLGPFLHASGQIPIERTEVDLRAIRTAVAALRSGLAVGVFPEGHRGAGEMTSPRSGAAYLAMVTGAPVVPVSFLGTRLPGGHHGSIPPRGSRVAMTFGHPVWIPARPWPRTQPMVAEAAAQVSEAIRTTMREAERVTGMSLPGPMGPSPEKPEKKKP